MVRRAAGCNKEHSFPLARTARKVAPNHCLTLKKKKEGVLDMHTSPYLPCSTFLMKINLKEGGREVRSEAGFLKCVPVKMSIAFTLSSYMQSITDRSSHLGRSPKTTRF